jgi:hypothetical protein
MRVRRDGNTRISPLQLPLSHKSQHKPLSQERHAPDEHTGRIREAGGRTGTRHATAHAIFFLFPCLAEEARGEEGDARSLEVDSAPRPVSPLPFSSLSESEVPTRSPPPRVPQISTPPSPSPSPPKLNPSSLTLRRRRRRRRGCSAGPARPGPAASSEGGGGGGGSGQARRAEGGQTVGRWCCGS